MAFIRTRKTFSAIRHRPENQRPVFPELVVPDDQWANFVKDRQGAIVGAHLAKTLRLENRRSYPHQGLPFWAAKHLGVQYRRHLPQRRPEDDETQFWFQWEYFEETYAAKLSKEMLAGTSSGWTNPDDAPRVAKVIDDMFANSPYETKTETESAFAAGWIKQFGNIEFLIEHRGRSVFYAASGYRKYHGHLRP